MRGSSAQIVLAPAALRWLRALLSCLLCTHSWACVSSPRATSELQQRSEPIEFSGLFEAPGIELELQAKNHKTQAWVTFAKAVTRAHEPVIGSTGSPYFRY